MRRALALSVALASFVALISIAPAAASIHGVTFDVELGTLPCVSGTAPASQSMVLSAKTPAGDLRARTLLHIDANGQWFACLGSFDGALHGRDRLIAKVNGVKTDWVLPDLSLRADRTAGTVYGQTIPYAHVTVVVPAEEGGNGFDRTVVANAYGRFRTTVGVRALIESRFAIALLEVGPNQVRAFAVSPAMEVRRGSDTVLGITNGYQPVQVRLFGTDGRIRASVTVQPVNGISWSATLRDGHGRPAYPAVGETVVASGGRGGRIVVPNATIHGDSANEVITGSCMPHARYFVDILHLRGRQFRVYAFQGTADEHGRVAKSLADKFDVATGDDLELACFFPTGDIYALNNIAR